LVSIRLYAAWPLPGCRPVRPGTRRRDRINDSGIPIIWRTDGG
jgi:hypothetical protein